VTLIHASRGTSSCCLAAVDRRRIAGPRQRRAPPLDRGLEVEL